MYEFKLIVSQSGSPLFETEWIGNKADALSVTRELARCFSPSAVRVTTRHTTRRGMTFEEQSAGDFLVESL